MKDIKKIGAWAVGAFALGLPAITRADTPTFLPSGVDADDIDLGQNDPVDTVVNVINWSLGIIGLISVAFIIYAGFAWMTAGGNEKQVETAKGILKAAIIGLIIVMVAYSVSLYVLTVLINVTGA